MESTCGTPPRPPAYLFLAAALGFALAALPVACCFAPEAFAFAGALLAADFFAGALADPLLGAGVVAFAFAGAPFAGALRAAGAGLPSRSAISSTASASVIESGRVDFGMVALTLPQLT